MRAAIGPWQWIDEGMGAGWYPPPGAVSVVDLRAVPDCERAGTYGDWPWSLFLFDDAATIPGDYHVLGSGRMDEMRPGTTSRDRWAECFGSGQPGGETVADWLAWQLTEGATPDGSAPCKPLIPTHLRVCEIHAPWHYLLRSWTFGQWNPEGDQYHNRVRDLLRNDLSELVTDCDRQRNELGQQIADLSKGKPDAAKRAQADRLSALRESLLYVPGKVLGGLCLKYRGLQAADISADVQPLQPTTTISDNFNGANSETFGVELSWTEQESGNAWRTNSNQGYFVCSSNGIRRRVHCNSALSSADHYSQLLATSRVSPETCIGPTVRQSTTDYTCYEAYIYTSTFSVARVSNGTPTALGSYTSGWSGNHTERLTLDGSTYTGNLDGTNRVTGTNSTISAGSNAGVMGYGSSSQYSYLDDFAAADLLSPVVLANADFSVQSPFTQGKSVGQVAASDGATPYAYSIVSQTLRS